MQQNPWLTSDILSRLSANTCLLLVRSLWEYCPEHMFIVRVEGPGNFVIEAMNSTHEMTSAETSAVIGKRIEQSLPAPLCHGVLANLGRCVESGAPVRYEENGDYLDRYGIHQHVHRQTLLVPITNTEGRVTHLFGISHDRAFSREHYMLTPGVTGELERQVCERMAELIAANEKLAYLATHDHLTSTYNRRYLMELAEQELRRAIRYELPLCLLMLDIDHFKTLNDARGHLVGDEALRCVARTILATVRECDLVGRYGGDEFLILMPETTASGAQELAERLRNTLTQTSRLTLSIGIASLAPGDDVVIDLIDRADALLLQAKRNGRNRIECAA